MDFPTKGDNVTIDVDGGERGPEVLSRLPPAHLVDPLELLLALGTVDCCDDSLISEVKLKSKGN